MFRAASWTCALLALASARVFDRCELASELLALGVKRDDISTWVCIAYHESRFDTTSLNYGSGDHGLFQISELFWCGPGKACGLPCSDLHDDDITDDVQCALHIREEHNRLQGDGFLAWVVYGPNCQHNTKKYIIDCDSRMKNTPVKTAAKSLNINRSNSTGFTVNPNIDNLRPPYLAINSIFVQSDKEFRGSGRKSVRNNWSNFKVQNIDDLILPVFSKNREEIRANAITPPPSTTTTSWPRKYVETKLFRKRIFHEEKQSITENQNESKLFPNNLDDVTQKTTTNFPSLTRSTTNNPVTRTIKTTRLTTVSPTPKLATTGSQRISTRQSKVATSSRSSLISTTRPTTILSTTTEPSTFVFTNSKTTSFPRNTVVTVAPNKNRPSSRFTTTTTSRPTLKLSKFNSVIPNTTTKYIYSTTLKPLPLPSKSTSTTERLNRERDRNPRAYSNFKSTTASLSWMTSIKTTTLRPVTLSATPRIVTAHHPVTTKATQSIFDLYLNPTKSPQLRTYKFPQFDNAFRLQIFSDGTTTPVPKPNRAGVTASPYSRNYVRRQT